MAEPILRWPGAKWRLADWIVKQLPSHKVYCEPFFGSGAVFFTKQPSGTETINDIDDNVVNLFRVVRNSADELARVIEMTPYSRKEYRDSYDSIGNEIERARRFLVRTWQAYGGKTYCSTAWAHDRTNQVFRPKYWCKLPGRILSTVERLKMVQIENMNALELIKLYNRENTLLYIDPPYLKSTRTQLHYKCEFASQSEHLELLRLCKKHKGYVMISSYENDLYNIELDGWEKSSMRVATNCGGSAEEIVYFSPNCTKQGNLFNFG
jgi:DNA adenine methylase